MSHYCWIALVLVAYLKISFSDRRILRGLEVNREKRYMVYFLISNDQPQKYKDWLCGGAIISTTHILTAAACLTDVPNLFAIAGYKKYVNSLDIDKDECTRTRRKRVASICVPKTYNLAQDVTHWMYVDIGIATVDSPYDFTDNTYRLQCSYPPDKIAVNYDPFVQKPGTDAVVMGWGSVLKMREPNDVVDPNSEYLRYARTVVIRNSDCTHAFNDDYISDIIDEFMICSGDVGALDIDGKEVKMAPKIENGCNNMAATSKSNVTDDDDTFDWLRRAYKPPKKIARNNTIETLDTTEPTMCTTTRTNETNSSFDYDSVEGRLIAGICQNDHGGPLVTWTGLEEVVIGVSSASRVRTSNLFCIPPFLYTSTYFTGLFIQCVVSGHINTEVRRRCTEAAKRRGIQIVENPVTWPENTTLNLRKHEDIESSTSRTSLFDETTKELSTADQDYFKDENYLKQATKNSNNNPTIIDNYNLLDIIMNSPNRDQKQKESSNLVTEKSDVKNDYFDPYAIIKDEDNSELRLKTNKKTFQNEGNQRALSTIEITTTDRPKIAIRQGNEVRNFKYEKSVTSQLQSSNGLQEVIINPEVKSVLLELVLEKPSGTSTDRQIKNVNPTELGPGNNNKALTGAINDHEVQAMLEGVVKAKSENTNLENVKSTDLDNDYNIEPQPEKITTSTQDVFIDPEFEAFFEGKIVDSSENYTGSIVKSPLKDKNALKDQSKSNNDSAQSDGLDQEVEAVLENALKTEPIKPDFSNENPIDHLESFKYLIETERTLLWDSMNISSVEDVGEVI